jgi:hypothetical protein
MDTPYPLHSQTLESFQAASIILRLGLKWTERWAREETVAPFALGLSFIQDMAEAPEASMTVASIIKLKII